MDEKRYQELAEKWLQGTISPEEKQAFTEWYRLKGKDMPQNVPEEFVSDEAAHQYRIWQKIQAQITPVVPINTRKRRLSYAAALFILITGGSLFLFLQQRSHAPILTAKTTAPVIAPGKNGAVLTLANGQQLVLDSLHNGVIATQQGAKVLLQNGQLTYDPTGETTDVAYNMIATPRGRQFQVTLPDGTKAWLNAASSIRYPTVFHTPERSVQITGEVYFEVAQNEKQPFSILINEDTKIEVLGTHFNVNAYADEKTVKTTLLEGAVKVSLHAANLVLKPGQQAQTLPNGLIKLLPNVDTEEAIAWKNGLFQLNSADVPAIMRQLSRWYDVEITYEDGIPNGHISGKVPRDMNLSEVLKVLELSGLHFKITGKNITVLK
ncbi:FecR family protein [Chitinophaga costaii]|nr:FecR family protein [Chitinophaga costaii]